MFMEISLIKQHGFILICPIESIKDTGLVLECNAGAIILDCYYDIPGLK